MDGPPLLFDLALRRARLARAAPRFAEAGFLKARAAADTADRISAVARRFERALDLAARDGAFARALETSGVRGQVGEIVEADLSGAMLADRAGLRVTADEARLPFADAAFDLVVCALGLHWIDDLPGALIQMRLALRPDGLLIASALGGATLTELRQCLLEAEAETAGGAAPRVSPFLDAPDGAALLQRAGFAMPVCDVDRVRVRYADPLALVRDLRAMGETNALLDGARRPLSRETAARTMGLYLERFADPDGRIPATFEIITLTGWAPGPDQPSPSRRGRPAPTR